MNFLKISTNIENNFSDNEDNYYDEERIEIPESVVRQIYNKPLGKLGRYNIWLMNGEMVRNFIDQDFLMGGNPGAYSYCPENEIWLEISESSGDFTAVLAHEFVECELMRTRGLDYEQAHEIAEVIEHKVRQRIIESPEPDDQHGLADIQKLETNLIKMADKLISTVEKSSQIASRIARLYKGYWILPDGKYVTLDDGTLHYEYALKYFGMDDTSDKDLDLDEAVEQKMIDAGGIQLREVRPNQYYVRLKKLNHESEESLKNLFLEEDISKDALLAILEQGRSGNLTMHVSDFTESD